MVSTAMQEKVTSLLAQRDAAAGASVPTLAERRRLFDGRAALYPLPDDVETTGVAAGGVPARWLLSPGAKDGRALLYLHGGGYQVGSSISHGELAARIGRASGMPVLAIDYRLAPEHPFPAAVEDATAAWRWLREAQGYPASALAVAGDSAGGGLALALLTILRDAGEAQPAAAALLSPWADLTGEGAATAEAATEAAADPILTAAMLDQLASGYLAGADPRSPLASPLYASLAGLAPLLIQVGTAEVLLGDSERLAAAAAAAGVDVTLQVTEGAPHVFQAMAETPEARDATDHIGEFLARRVVTPGG